MQNLDERITEQLEKRKAAASFRTLSAGEAGGVDFSSNDYLGLAKSSELADSVQERLKELPVSNGSGGSRLLSGNSAPAEALELQMAAFFRAEACLLFNSGYSANLGILSALPQKNDTVLYDELAHASIKDGVRLSMAKRYSFKHNNTDKLRRYLEKAAGQVFVVIESVYSMDGDVAPLEEFAALCKEFGAALIVDEAHSTGIYGQGSGLVCELGLEQEVFARVHTFGKAIGCHGACVAGSQKLKDYLINFSRPFIYTTALPVHTLLSLEAAFNHIGKHPELAAVLQKKINWFKTLKQACLEPMLVKELQTESSSPVQPIVVPGNEEAGNLARALREKGFNLKAVLAPTVPAGKERLRICLHVYNTEKEIEDLIKAIARYLS